MMQGMENRKLMLSQRKMDAKKKGNELAEYREKYQEDLMARLTQRNEREMSERRAKMQRLKEFKE